LNYARKHRIIISDKYKEFEIKKEQLEVLTLTNEEFETLFAFDLTGNKSLAQSKGRILFSCATGLR
jgi:hypothetical protein